MKLFSVPGGVGAKISTFRLSRAEMEIPAILVGEEGRGRKLGVLPADRSLVGFADEQQTRYELRDPAGEYAIGTTRSGGPKLISGGPNPDACIVVFRTPIGFRGSNDHTGDRIGWPCPRCYEPDTAAEKPENGSRCPHCGEERDWGLRGAKLRFREFPGKVVVEGLIAEGDAGRMGSGRQLVAVVPAGMVFRTGYYGRLYGGAPSHYHRFDGSSIISVTWDERVATEVF